MRTYGSFGFYVEPGHYDLTFTKPGYTFQPQLDMQVPQDDLTLGTMAQQDAANVAITGGSATGLTSLSTALTTSRLGTTLSTGVLVPNHTPASSDPVAFYGDVSAGANRFNCFMNGNALNFFQGHVLVGQSNEVAGVPSRLLLSYLHGAIHGLSIKPSDADTGGGQAAVFSTWRAHRGHDCLYRRGHGVQHQQ